MRDRRVEICRRPCPVGHPCSSRRCCKRNLWRIEWWEQPPGASCGPPRRWREQQQPQELEQQIRRHRYVTWQAIEALLLKVEFGGCSWGRGSWIGLGGQSLDGVLGQKRSNQWGRGDVLDGRDGDGGSIGMKLHVAWMTWTCQPILWTPVNDIRTLPMSSNRRKGNVRRFHSAACDLRMATVRLGQSEHQETDGGHTGKVAIDGPYISANNRLGRPLQTMGWERRGKKSTK